MPKAQNKILTCESEQSYRRLCLCCNGGMITLSAHVHILRTYNTICNLARPLSFLIGSFSFLQVTRTTIKARMSSNFGRIPPLTSESAALERLKKSNYKFVSTLVPSFLIRSYSVLQVTRTTIHLSNVLTDHLSILAYKSLFFAEQ